VAFQATTAFVGLMLVECCKSNGVRHGFWALRGAPGMCLHHWPTRRILERKFCCRSIAPSMRGPPNIIAEIDAECCSVVSGLHVYFGAIGGVITANVFLQRGAEISDWYLGSCGTSLPKIYPLYCALESRKELWLTSCTGRARLLVVVFAAVLTIFHKWAIARRIRRRVVEGLEGFRYTYQMRCMRLGGVSGFREDTAFALRFFVEIFVVQSNTRIEKTRR
jgi:hypothetical protein